ncbi:alpha/beta hydrolase-fold protein [Candidatus Poribacteria bacterium]
MITRKIGLCFAYVLLTAFAFVLQATAQAPPVPEYPPIPDYLVQDQFTSPSLEGNLLGDSATRDVLVYLPPSYDASPDRHYPTIYVLAGYLGDHRAYVGHINTTMQALTGMDMRIDLGDIVPGLLANGGMGEAIIVLPDCLNIYGGTIYERSEVTGDYRGYIARDLVGYMDAQYRTIPDREHRGITGHSSGAYGAVSLAMEYPDVFGSVAALSPAYLVDRQRETAFLGYMELNPDSHGVPTLVSSDTRDEDMWDIWMGTFGTTVTYGIASGFSPNPDNPPYYVDIPVTYTDGTAALDEDLWAQWVERDLISQIERDGASLSDTPVLIAAGTIAMGEQPGVDLILTALHGHGISYEYDGYPGGHMDHLGYELASALRFLSPNIGAIPMADYSNTFFMDLSPGLNMISVPLAPVVQYTARSLAEEIGATAVIKYDTMLGKFVGFTPAASGDGFAINGGEGCIVNVIAGGTVAFTGAAWANEPSVAAAPPVQSSGAWAFVVSGSVLDGGLMSASDGGYTAVVKNLRTGETFTEPVDPSGYFAAAWADLNRRAVIGAGDKVEVAVVDSGGGIVSGPFIHEVTLDAIRDAVVNVRLNLGAIIPAKSVLLQNYPNPFNPETWMPYHLSNANPVMVKIYSASGQLIRTLDLGHRDAGIYASRSKAAYWDGRNEAGEEVASAVYFYSITAGDFSAMRKMVVKK